jgi:hypothetical protein
MESAKENNGSFALKENGKTNKVMNSNKKTKVAFGENT